VKDVLNCIKKYVEITEDEKFILHWKKLSERLLKGILESYIRREPETVRIIENIINNIGQFNTEEHHRFNISTNSIFIHGNKSQVEFEYYGKSTKRELGDIIFILSVVYNGRKYFEKMTINQIKKSRNVSWNFNTDSAREQLYLLSRFPAFKGAKNSIIPKKDYNLPNYSGCLGSHGLLYYPGDFALISSKQLDVILSGKNKLELANLVLSIVPNNPCLCLHIDFEECFYLLHKLIHFYPRCLRYFPFICNLPILGNSCISYNAYDFSDKYLRGVIGELIYAKGLGYNHQAFQFLMDLLESIERKGGKYKSFVQNFRKFNYNPIGYGKDKIDKKDYEFDRDGGGLGITHTIIDLREGK